MSPLFSPSEAKVLLLLDSDRSRFDLVVGAQRAPSTIENAISRLEQEHLVERREHEVLTLTSLGRRARNILVHDTSSALLDENAEPVDEKAVEENLVATLARLESTG